MFDEVEFNRICVEERSKMIGMAAHKLGSKRNRDAEDVVQEALLSAWKHKDTFREEAALRTWLHTILIHCIYNHPRHKDPIVADGVSLSENHDRPSQDQSILQVLINKEILSKVLPTLSVRFQAGLNVWANENPLSGRGDKSAAFRGRQELRAVAIKLGIVSCPVLLPVVPKSTFHVRGSKRTKPCLGVCTTTELCPVCKHRAIDRKTQAKFRASKRVA